MEQKIKKFLEFNGQILYFMAIDGNYWIAIRPICDALNIQFSRILKNIKSDEILGQLWSKQTMVGADFKLRKMVSLPEKYIYGWLFSIRSGSELLREYKKKCYDLLYEYFHGSITSRHQVLIEKQETLAEIQERIAELSDDPRYKALNDLHAKAMRLGKKLKEMDDEFIHGQLSINFDQSN